MRHFCTLFDRNYIDRGPPQIGTKLAGPQPSRAGPGRELARTVRAVLRHTVVAPA